jgi:hypothetical protein
VVNTSGEVEVLVLVNLASDIEKILLHLVGGLERGEVGGK